MELTYPVAIMARSKTAHKRLLRLGNDLHADQVDPIFYKCLGCGCEWEDSPLRDYSEVVCSNCYGERVKLTKVRLWFRDWGPQNGGVEEQMSRYLWAKSKLSTTPHQATGG